MADEPLRMQILNMIEEGEISADEGLRWLQALANNAALPAELDDVLPARSAPDQAAPDLEHMTAAEPGTSQAESADFSSADNPAARLPFDAARIRRWWVVPLWVGVGVVVISGLLMYWAMQAQGVGFWFACSSMPMILGLILIVLAVQSRTARWLYLRIEQPGDEWPHTIQFGFPLPIRPAAWLLRFIKGRIPNMPDIAMDEILLALGRSATPENPFYVAVDDDRDGKKVEIFIG